MVPRLPDEREAGPIRVLHLVSTFAVKTDTKWLLQLARHFDPARVALTAACFYEGGPIQGSLESLGVPTHNFNVPGEHDPRGLMRAHTFLRNNRFDVVHTHLLRADLVGGSAARLARVPVVLSSVYAMGAYRRAKRRSSDTWLDLACASLPTHFLAVSEAVARDCIENHGLPAEQVSVLHTGIDPDVDIDPAKVNAFRASHLDGGEKLVITLSRLSYEKGVEVLVEAAVRLRDTCPSARIAVLGDGPDRPQLESLIAAHGVEKTIKLCGFCEDVWPALCAADVVCMPSRSEGMPNVLLEAMSVGKPVVATRVGGIPEAITHGVDGWLVEPGDATALADGLVTVMRDAERASSIGEAAQQTVNARFHVRDVAGRYADLYSDLVRQWRCTREIATAH